MEGRLTDIGCSDSQIAMIGRFTKGLPLAVSLTVALLGVGQTVEDVCQEVVDGHVSSVISGLARRYLVHAERRVYATDDPRKDDIMRILGLALAFGDLRDDPELLSALWLVDDPLAAFRDLARRYDFVLPISRRLHGDVRDALRVDLLDPYRRAHAREMSTRAIALLNGRIETLRRRWPGLDEQVRHTAFTTTLLSLLWHTFWLGNQEGLDLFFEVLPVLAVTAPDTATAAAAMAGQFTRTFDASQKVDLGLLTQLRPAPVADESLAKPPGSAITAGKRVVDITQAGLTLLSRAPATAPTPLATPGDRSVAIMLLKARMQIIDHDDESAITLLESAFKQTGSSLMQRVTGALALEITRKHLRLPENHANNSSGLAAAKLSTLVLPASPIAWNFYAISLSRVRSYDESLLAYDRAIEIDPQNAVFHANRGTALQSLGRYKEAIAVYDAAISSDPNNAVAHNVRGNAMTRLGRYDEALASYSRAVQLDPGDAVARSNLASSLRSLGRYADSLIAADKAVELDPDNSTLHANRATTLRALDRRDEALTTHQKSIELKPDNPAAWTARGITLNAYGHYAESAESLRNAVELDPENSLLHCGYGLTLFTSGQAEESFRELDRAIELEPANGRLYEAKGIVLAITGNLDGALLLFESARQSEQNSNLGEGNTWAGAILWHRNDPAAAQTLFSQVKGNITDAPFGTAELEAIAYCGLGFPEKGEQRLRGAVPLRAPGDGKWLEKLYELMSDPLAPGIDRLLDIRNKGK